MPAGHRLRPSISSCYWPLIWPAPGAATLRLTAGSLSLPLAKEAGSVTFPPPETAEPWQPEEMRPAAHVRQTVLDQRSGVTGLRIVDDFGQVRDLATGLEIGSVAREWWDIHPDDPLSARGRTHWTDTLGRGNWQVRSETFSQMWADAGNFHLIARIEAYEGETLIFERDLKRSIPRDLV
jgi:hypothetical protein